MCSYFSTKDTETKSCCRKCRFSAASFDLSVFRFDKFFCWRISVCDVHWCSSGTHFPAFTGLSFVFVVKLEIGFLLTFLVIGLFRSSYRASNGLSVGNIRRCNLLPRCTCLKICRTSLFRLFCFI